MSGLGQTQQAKIDWRRLAADKNVGVNVARALWEQAKAAVPGDEVARSTMFRRLLDDAAKNPGATQEPGKSTLVDTKGPADPASLGPGKTTQVLLDKNLGAAPAADAKDGKDKAAPAGPEAAAAKDATKDAGATPGADPAKKDEEAPTAAPTIAKLHSDLVSAAQASQDAAALLTKADPATIMEVLRQLRSGSPSILQKVIEVAGAAIERRLGDVLPDPQTPKSEGPPGISVPVVGGDGDVQNHTVSAAGIPMLNAVTVALKISEWRADIMKRAPADQEQVTPNLARATTLEQTASDQAKKTTLGDEPAKAALPATQRQLGATLGAISRDVATAAAKPPAAPATPAAAAGPTPANANETAAAPAPAAPAATNAPTLAAPAATNAAPAATNAAATNAAPAATNAAPEAATPGAATNNAAPGAPTAATTPAAPTASATPAAAATGAEPPAAAAATKEAEKSAEKSADAAAAAPNAAPAPNAAAPNAAAPNAAATTGAAPTAAAPAAANANATPAVAAATPATATKAVVPEAPVAEGVAAPATAVPVPRTYDAYATHIRTTFAGEIAELAAMGATAKTKGADVKRATQRFELTVEQLGALKAEFEATKAQLDAKKRDSMEAKIKAQTAAQPNSGLTMPQLLEKAKELCARIKEGGLVAKGAHAQLEGVMNASIMLGMQIDPEGGEKGRQLYVGIDTGENPALVAKARAAGLPEAEVAEMAVNQRNWLRKFVRTEVMQDHNHAEVLFLRDLGLVGSREGLDVKQVMVKVVAKLKTPDPETKQAALRGDFSLENATPAELDKVYAAVIGSAATTNAGVNASSGASATKEPSAEGGPELAGPNGAPVMGAPAALSAATPLPEVAAPATQTPTTSALASPTPSAPAPATTNAPAAADGAQATNANAPATPSASPPAAPEVSAAPATAGGSPAASASPTSAAGSSSLPSPASESPAPASADASASAPASPALSEAAPSAAETSPAPAGAGVAPTTSPTSAPAPATASTLSGAAPTDAAPGSLATTAAPAAASPALTGAAPTIPAAAAPPAGPEAAKDATDTKDAPATHTLEQSKAEIASVTSAPIVQGKGEEQAVLALNPPSIKIKTDSPDPIRLKDEVITLTKEYLELDKRVPEPAPAERQAKLNAIKLKFAALRSAMSKARGEEDKVVQLRAKFEKFLGVKATHGWTQGTQCVTTMSQQARLMLVEAEMKTTVSAADLDRQLQSLSPDAKNAIGKKLGTPVNIGFAGAVGNTFKAVNEALTSGSLVQKCQTLINFSEKVMTGELMKGAGPVFERAKANLAAVKTTDPHFDLDARLQAAKDKDPKLQYKLLCSSPEFLAKMDQIKKVQNKDVDKQREAEGGPLQNKSKKSSDNTQLGGDMDTKLPQQPVENLTEAQLDFLSQQGKPSVDLTPFKTEPDAEQRRLKKVSALKGAGIHTSQAPGVISPTTGKVEGEGAVDATSIDEDAVRATVDRLTVENRFYIEGKAENIVDPKAKWIIDANAAKAPLKAGISGTTARFVGAANLLGGTKHGAVVAMIGHLQAIEAHSFWEMVDAAGLPMQPGKYTPFAPNPTGMTSAASEFIATQATDIDLGPVDAAAKQKILLGETESK